MDVRTFTVGPVQENCHIARRPGAAQALTMCVVAFVLYTPLMYFTDKWIYSRKLKQQQGGAAPARGRR